MESPERVLGLIALACLLMGGAPLVSPRLAAWYLKNTPRGRLTAVAMGEERATRLIRFGLAPVLVLAGVAAGAYAVALATGVA